MRFRDLFLTVLSGKIGVGRETDPMADFRVIEAAARTRMRASVNRLVNGQNTNFLGLFGKLPPTRFASFVAPASQTNCFYR